MFSRIILPLLLISACSSFKSGKNLSDIESKELLSKVDLTGEGRGRLSINESQNVFSYEAVLKENNDWLLAISIPLHGEEVLIFPDLKQKLSPNEKFENFELRLEGALKEQFPKQEVTGREFIQALRKMVRFLQATKLGLVPDCTDKKEKQLCVLDEDTFEVEVTKSYLGVKMAFLEGFILEARSQNLTGPIFKQTKFSLNDVESKKDRLSLELFWK